MRDAAQTNSQKHQDVVIQFDATNPATVVAVMTKHDTDIIDDDKFINVLVKHCSRNRAKKIAINKLIKKFKTHNIKYVIFDIVYRDEK